MSERVNQINEATSRTLREEGGLTGEGPIPQHIRTLLDAARDFADLLSRLEDGSLVEEATKAIWIAWGNKWPPKAPLSVSIPDANARLAAKAALAALGLQEATDE